MTPVFKIKTITPADAQKHLKDNDRNRRVNPRYVAQLVNEIKSGRWSLNGDAIRFDVNGRLIDGQHRLSACVTAGIPIETLVATGLEPEIQDTVDTGRSRSTADLLEMAGIKYSQRIATTANLCMAYEAGTQAFAWIKPLPNQVAAWAEENREGLIASNQFVRDLEPPKRCGITEPQLTFLHFMASQLGFEVEVRDFIEQYTTKAGITAGSGVQRLIKFVDIHNIPHKRLSPHLYLAVIIWCFNHFAGKSKAPNLNLTHIKTRIKDEGMPRIGAVNE